MSYSFSTRRKPKPPEQSPVWTIIYYDSNKELQEAYLSSKQEAYDFIAQEVWAKGLHVQYFLSPGQTAPKSKRKDKPPLEASQ
mgnify:CR=1 FL=1